MALTTPLADDAAIFEYSYTVGNTGVYQLAGAFGGFFTFKSEWPAGAASIPIRVTDGRDAAANTEISNAAYNAGANTLTVISIIASTSGGAPINWTGRTRLLVHALQKGLPLCATPPTAGQVLAWDAVAMEWCPETLPSSIPLCATPPMDGQVLVWDAAMNEWCPADFCALVTACLTPTCLPYIVYSNRLVIPAYAGDLYTIRRSSDNAMMAFAPTGGDAPSAAINTFIGAGNGFVSLWNDQSGNGFDVTEDMIDFGSGPQWIASAVNSHPALLFSNLAGTFSGTLQGTGIGFSKSAWTVFMILRHAKYTDYIDYPTVHDTSAPFAIAGASNDPFFGVVLTANPVSPPTGAQIAVSANDDTNTNDTSFTEFLSGFGMSDAYMLVEFTLSDNIAAADARLNNAPGSSLFTVQDGGPFTTSPAAIRVGFDFSRAGDLYIGWMAEIQVYNCVLTSSERTTIRNNIAAYYGITLS